MARCWILVEGIRVGIGIQIEGLTKSFGAQRIWEDVTLSLIHISVPVVVR